MTESNWEESMEDKKPFARVTILIGILCVFAAPGVGQGSSPVIDSVTRGNWNALSGEPAAADAPESTLHWVVMPDGILLATEVWLPTTGGPTFPTVFIRTPYGRMAQEATALFYVQNDYAVVVQECRGTHDSFGTFEAYRHAGPDGHATIEWIALQPWSNGDVGMVGKSALGATQYAVAQGAPAALKCLSPSHESPDRYHHIAFQGGAVRYELVWNWLNNQGVPNIYYEMLEHRLWDSWWWDFDWIGFPGTIHVPTLHLSGWYDMAQQGGLDAFSIVQHQGGVGAAGNQYLIMDPLTHRRTQGQLVFPDPELDYSQLKLDWLDYWLKGDPTGVDSWPAVRIYLMGASGEPGAPGNLWVEMEDWPPAAETRSFYLAQDGGLSESIPPSGQLILTIDPHDPVTTYGGANLYGGAKFGPYDQAANPSDRPIESRADVLTFTTDVLTEPITVMGRVSATIWINPDTPDLDLSVRLTDVYPDGRSMLIIDGIQRARMRCTDTAECFLVPGVPTEIEVDLWSTAMVFNAGHRIRVAIAGTNWERFEINSNDGGDLNNPNYIVANPEILFGPQYPSALFLPFPALLFADDFESGDTSAWSATVP